MPPDELSPLVCDAVTSVWCTDRRTDYLYESVARGGWHVEYVKVDHLAEVLAVKPAVTECEVTVDVKVQVWCWFCGRL